MRYKVCICYDGTNYYGFQKQKDKLTIQSELERVLSKIFNESINITGCSRTDRGVHANNFYFHFDTQKEKDTSKLVVSMNKLLPKDIYTKSISKVNNEFHARYSVISKEYIYLIDTGVYKPTLRNILLEYNKNIDVSKLEKASNYLIGTHDFKSFTSDERENTIRTINLKYMIRNIVGLFLEINEGIKSVSDVSKILESKDRTRLGKKTESSGLYLNEVNYERL